MVEFSYPVDSRKNPMVQLSDLVVLCTRRFLEVEHEYHDNYPEEAKLFYAECYSIIQDRIPKKQVVQRCGRGMDCVNDYLEEVQCKPRRLWRRQYGLN